MSDLTQIVSRLEEATGQAEQATAAYKGAILNVGYALHRAYEDAVTLTQANDAVQFSEGGIFYRWDGAYPQGGLLIPQGTPEPTSGQTGPGKYVAVLDLSVKDALLTLLSAPSGSGLVGFIQNYLGAVPRTLQDKGSDILNALDFGADPTGVKGSHSAIKNIISALKKRGGGVVVFPPGEYLLDKVDGTYTVPDLTSEIQWGTTTFEAQLYIQSLNNSVFLFIGATLVSNKANGGTTLLLDGCSNTVFSNLRQRGATVISPSGDVVTSGTTAVMVTSQAGDSNNLHFPGHKTTRHYGSLDVVGNPRGQYKAAGLYADDVEYTDGYYGLSLRGNGQSVRVRGVSRRQNRPFFIYDTSNVEVDLVHDSMNGGFQSLIKAYTENVINICVKVHVAKRLNNQSCVGIQSQHNPAVQPTPAYVRSVDITYTDIASTDKGLSILFSYYKLSSNEATSPYFLFGDISIKGKASSGIGSSVAITSRYNLGILNVSMFSAPRLDSIFYGNTCFTTYVPEQWAPVDASGAGITIEVDSCNLVVDKTVSACFSIKYPTTSDNKPAKISGLPIRAMPSDKSVFPVSISYTDCGFGIYGLVDSGGESISWYKSTGVSVTNAELSGKSIRGLAQYFMFA